MGKKELLTAFLKSVHQSQKNGDTRRHDKYKCERAGILPCLAMMGNRTD
jgi:hypothetical protein